MAFTIPKPSKPPTIDRKPLDSWLKGVVTAFDSARTPIDGLLSATNVVLEQDGTVRPRPSLRKYGPQPLGTVLGEIFEYKVQTGLSSTYWMCCLQTVGGTTNLYRARGEDTTWTICPGKTYTNNARGHFIQIQNKVLIMNGQDTLSYLDLSSNLVIPYTTLTDPASAPTGTATGLTGTAYNVYYAITANSNVGQTTGSPALTQPVSTQRDLWNPSTQNVKITWTAIANAKSYNVYCGVSADGAGIPQMYLIASGLDAAILTFTDDGSRAQDLNQPLPTKNSTAGPKASRGSVISNRAWLVGDKDNPFYVWRGGDYGYELDFSPANGGGYSSIGNGTKEVPIAVSSFRSGKGDPLVTVLSQGSNGDGRRYLLSPATVTYGSTTVSYWAIQEDSGADGTDSPDGVISYQNSLYYPSRDGFKTTGTKPQLQNVLSTDRISNTIQNDISRLNTSKMSMAVGVPYEGRLYWSLPVGANSNNEMWVLDLDRGGAWMRPWNISADWLWLYNDNSGITHFCVLQGNSIYEMNYTQTTNDDGVGFLTNGNSGINKFSDDGLEWAKLIKVIFTVIRPQGSIAFTVSALTDDGIQTYIGGDTYGVDSTVAGWGEPSGRGITGWGRHVWSEVEAVPVASGLASVDIEVEVDEDVQWWTFGWSSNGIGADYQLSKVVPESVNIGLKNLS